MKQFQFVGSTTVIELCYSNNANISSFEFEHLNSQHLNLLWLPTAEDLPFHC